MRIGLTILFFCGFCTLAGGCASAKLNVKTPLPEPVNRVSLALEDKTGTNLTEEQLGSLRTAVTTKLEEAGVTVVPSDAPALTGQVLRFEPGSQFWRWFIGMGVGTGEFESTWRLTYTSGTVAGECDITGSVSGGVFGGSFTSVLEKVALRLTTFLGAKKKR